MKNLLLISFVLIIGITCVNAQTDSTGTKNYVSLNGKFYIDYPASWVQIPYEEFDRYLASKKADRPIYDYDVVYASGEKAPFYMGSYFIMSVEPVGQLSGKQIDSVLNDLSANFGKGIKYFPVANFLSDMQTNAPSYDKATKTVSIYSKIVQHEKSIKNSLIMMKFYDFGIATFYFYAMDDSFENDKNIFNEIVASLNTQDIQSKLPKQELKIADIDTTKKTTYDTEDDSSNLAIYVSLGVVLIIVISRRRKKKNNS